MTREQIRQVLVEGGLWQISMTNVWAERETYAIMVELYDDSLDLVINDEKTMCHTNYFFNEIDNFKIDKYMEKYTEIIIKTVSGNRNRFLIEC